MRVQVLCFASAREATGTGAHETVLAEGATIQSLADHLVSTFPALAEVLPTLRFAVGVTFCDAAHVLHDGATVALIPPVGGG